MSTLRRVATALPVACSLGFGAPAAEAHPSPSPMVDSINRVRSEYGLSALHYSPSLARSSARFVRHLGRTNRFAHAAQIRANSRFSKLGEVLARTPGRDVRRAQALAGWLASRSHRAVLLSPSFSFIGAARTATGSRGNKAVLWAVQVGK